MHGTEWFVARDDLGAEGQDADRIMRLASHMRASRAQTPTLEYRELEPVRASRHLSRLPGLTLPRPLGLANRHRDNGHGRGR